MGELEDVCFVNDQYGWAVGSDILYTENGGLDWTRKETTFQKNWKSVCFSDQQHGWIGGQETGSDDPFIYHTSDGGQNWDSQLIPVQKDINALFFTDNQTGWAAGEDGTILHTVDGGNTWEIQDAGIVWLLESLFFIDANNGWVVGTDQGPEPTDVAVLKTMDGGANWQALAFDQDYHGFQTVFFLDAQSGYLAGPYSPTHGSPVVLFTDDGGDSWTEQPVPTESTWLTDVFFTSAQEGWVTTAIGEIFYTNDGGTTWTLQDQKIDNRLWGLFFPDTENGWAVGSQGTILKFTQEVNVTEEPAARSIPEIRVTPNPTTGAFTLDLPAENLYTIKLFTPSGQLASTLERAGMELINLNSLAPGLYILHIFSEKEAYTGKILISR
jgi:photosystem II stability/assembly factor-like uncharacterized protein